MRKRFDLLGDKILALGTNFVPSIFPIYRQNEKQGTNLSPPFFSTGASFSLDTAEQIVSYSICPRFSHILIYMYYFIFLISIYRYIEWRQKMFPWVCSFRYIGIIDILILSPHTFLKFLLSSVISGGLGAGTKGTNLSPDLSPKRKMPRFFRCIGRGQIIENR